MSKKMNKRKCPVCNKMSKAEEMLEYDRVPNRMYHPECLEIAMEKQKFIDAESELKDEFWNTFAEMIGFKLADITPTGYSMGENLRNGNPVFRGKPVEKRYKGGFGWDVMTATIVSRRQTIENAIENKDFQTMNALCAYIFKIIMNYIPMMNKKIMKQRKAEELMKAKQADVSEDMRFEATIESIEKEKTVKRKRKRKKEETVDISAFLD